MEIKLENMLKIYVAKVQTHDTKTMEYIKGTIKVRYHLSEEQFKSEYSKFLDTYVFKKQAKVYY